MNRKAFLQLLTLPLTVAACRFDNGDTKQRVPLLEADLSRELLQVGDYKQNTTVGLFVRRQSGGNTAQDFACFWTICTHARCPVVYQAAGGQFHCPCHGSLFDGEGRVLQGPAADRLQQQPVEISGNLLRVYG